MSFANSLSAHCTNELSTKNGCELVNLMRAVGKVQLIPSFTTTVCKCWNVNGKDANRLRNGIFVKSYTKRFTEITNCNLSQRLVELTLHFFNDVEEHDFPLDCMKSFLKLGERFFSTVT